MTIGQQIRTIKEQTEQIRAINAMLEQELEELDRREKEREKDE